MLQYYFSGGKNLLEDYAIMHAFCICLMLTENDHICARRGVEGWRKNNIIVSVEKKLCIIPLQMFSLQERRQESASSQNYAFAQGTIVGN